MKIRKIIAPSVVGIAAIAGIAAGSALNAVGASADTSAPKHADVIF